MTVAVANGIQKKLQSTTSHTKPNMFSELKAMFSEAKQGVSLAIKEAKADNWATAGKLAAGVATNVAIVGGCSALGAVIGSTLAPGLGTSAGAFAGAKIGSALAFGYGVSKTLQRNDLEGRKGARVAAQFFTFGLSQAVLFGLDGAAAEAQTPGAEVHNPDAHDGQPTRAMIGAHPYGSGQVLAFDDSNGHAWSVATAPGVEDRMLDEWVRGDGTNPTGDAALDAQEAQNARGPMFRAAPIESGYTSPYSSIDWSNFGRSITEVEAELDADGGEKMSQPKMLAAQADGSLQGDMGLGDDGQPTGMPISADATAQWNTPNINVDGVREALRNLGYEGDAYVSDNGYGWGTVVNSDGETIAVFNRETGQLTLSGSEALQELAAEANIVLEQREDLDAILSNNSAQPKMMTADLDGGLEDKPFGSEKMAQQSPDVHVQIPQHDVPPQAEGGGHNFGSVYPQPEMFYGECDPSANFDIYEQDLETGRWTELHDDPNSETDRYDYAMREYRSIYFEDPDCAISIS